MDLFVTLFWIFAKALLVCGSLLVAIVAGVIAYEAVRYATGTLKRKTVYDVPPGFYLVDTEGER